jgi:hypothetical protein
MAQESEQVGGQVVEEGWVGFPGGELEGKRPKALCAACQDALKRAATRASRAPGGPSPSRTLCFQCYRAELDRERALSAAGTLDTASEARFQSQLPFEPVKRGRLAMLKADRAGTRAAATEGVGRYADRRRRAQIEARHALLAIASELKARRLAPAVEAQAMEAAIHAAEIQLPDAWLPFVVSR